MESSASLQAQPPSMPRNEVAGSLWVQCEACSKWRRLSRQQHAAVDETQPWYGSALAGLLLLLCVPED